MAFEELKENAENIQDQLKSFTDANLAYYKLKSFKTVMSYSTTMLKILLLATCLMFVLVFCSIALAFALSAYFDNYVFGFLSVGGIYIVVMIILYLARNIIIEGPILKKFSKIIFKQ
jgi:ABC-type sugar transport system permease subunit